MLITCALDDYRVPFWGPAKYAAQLRHVNVNKNTVLLQPNMDEGGHFARHATADAEELAFLLTAGKQ